MKLDKARGWLSKYGGESGEKVLDHVLRLLDPESPEARIKAQAKYSSYLLLQLNDSGCRHCDERPGYGVKDYNITRTYRGNRRNHRGNSTERFCWLRGEIYCTCKLHPDEAHMCTLAPSRHSEVYLGTQRPRPVSYLRNAARRLGSEQPVRTIL